MDGAASTRCCRMDGRAQRPRCCEVRDKARDESSSVSKDCLRRAGRLGLISRCGRRDVYRARRLAATRRDQMDLPAFEGAQSI